VRAQFETAGRGGAYAKSWGDPKSVLSAFSLKLSELIAGRWLGQAAGHRFFNPGKMGACTIYHERARYDTVWSSLQMYRRSSPSDRGTTLMRP
jgi:hypothetical protein